MWFVDWLRSLVNPVSEKQPYKVSPQKWYVQTVLDLKKDEGCSLTSYWDAIGNCWTVGYGHTYKVVQGMKITQQQAEQFLKDDLDVAVGIAKSTFKNFDSIDWVRKTVLINMAFNLGMNRLGEFKKMILAVDTGDYQKAALEMVNSKWRGQVGQRAIRLANRMRSGAL